MPIQDPTGLPEHLAERTRGLNQHEIAADRDFVLYWMRTACRGHENPALDVAITAANRLDRPVFVYHALSERYPYASDRHHTFILEGARDVQREMARRGIGYAFHLERPGAKGPHLLTLAARAALTVTEDMPVEPLRSWSERLAGAVDTAVWAVDTACLVPMQLVGEAHDRAFAFRRATQAARAARLPVHWTDVAPARPAFVPSDLPFTPIDFACEPIPELVASCDIDHLVGPVPHTRGGSTAGYARWSAFRDGALKRYARDRNNALQPDAVSRLSAYLHHGQVSPFRIAREAAAKGGDGASKFLDELLVWRELSYAWCFYRHDHHRISALPAWALSTLRAHALDPRPALLSWEVLARAQTGEGLWDAAQRSLLIHGELHNNVRMTWGKALAQWTSSPEACLDLLVDLNHRYALDGRDPNSYGGLMWCLGLFDRPFTPGGRILGTVRSRSLASHARRLDGDTYSHLTGRPAVPKPPRIALIGAGLAGLICARTLADHGLEVQVFEKSRGPGGRMAHRRADPFAFDHGAQYFTVRDPNFRRHVESWLTDGLVAAWRPRLQARAPGEVWFVATPGMTALGRHLARGLDLTTEVRIGDIEREQAAWRLRDSKGRHAGSFDVVLVAVPAPQAVPLLAAAPDLAAEAAAVKMAPCWALLVGYEHPLDLDVDAIRFEEGPIAWAARNSSKPARSARESWVLHASPSWSAEHLEEQASDVESALLEMWRRVVGTGGEPVHIQAHRWRHALASGPLRRPCLYDPALGLGACGDWCLGGRVEAAFLSASALTGRVLGALSKPGT